MHDLDETDLEILSLLAADARRPYSEIGEAVGLSGPAVSDRVSRLEETGVIQRFTLEIDRDMLRAGIPVFVQLTVPEASLDSVRDQIGDHEAVEHVFVTADGEIWFSGRAERGRVHDWIDALLDGVNADVSVTLLDEVAWTPSVEGVEFALTCAECGNTVDAEGESARIGGELYHFCCSSCRRRFSERHDRIAEDA